MTYNKQLVSADEEGTKFLIKILEGHSVKGIDIDNLYYKSGQFIIIDLLRCIRVRPYNSHPNRYWGMNRGKFLMLWKLKEKTNGRLLLVNHEDSMEQTTVIEVLEMDYTGIKKEKKKNFTLSEFKYFWQSLNNNDNLTICL